MTEKKEDHVVYEQEGEYKITVYNEKARLKYEMLSRWEKGPGCVPHFIEHTRKAVEAMPEGYTLLSIVISAKPPAFSVNSILKDALKIIKEKKVSKGAAVVSSNYLLQKMTLGVLFKLTGFNFRVFKDEDEAVKWLDGKE